MSLVDYVFNIHQKLQNKKIILVFEGGFTQQLTKNILALTERNMVVKNEKLAVKKKVFNVMIECLQNIVKHIDDADKTGEDIQDGIFMLGKDGNGYFLVSGNIIGNEHIEDLERRIIEVNNLDKSELKELFLQKLQGNQLIENGSNAGLGLIDIARKSGQKLEYEFEKINDKISFYTLHTKVPHKY
jgi:hypothetical protein